MRLAFLLFALAYALLVSAPAHAQTVPCPAPAGQAVGHKLFLDWKAWGYTRGNLGWFGVYYCIKPDGTALLNMLYVCPHAGGGCNPSRDVETITKVKEQPDGAAIVAVANAAIAAANPQYTCGEVKDEISARGDLCREAQAWEAKHHANWTANFVPPAPPPPPVVEVWKVAYNSACSDANKLAGTCTRPVSAYNPLTKTRSVAKGETVAVGAPCYPAVVTHKDSATSTITYMAIDPLRTDRVAVCAKAG